VYNFIASFLRVNISFSRDDLPNEEFFADEIDAACSTSWGRGGTRIGCRWESQMEGGHEEDQDVGGWIILGWIL
jgi:hypothetical protein